MTQGTSTVDGNMAERFDQQVFSFFLLGEKSEESTWRFDELVSAILMDNERRP